MKLLDLFCGAGGAAMGYYQGGFTDIVGVDIRPQPRYPFSFVQGDAMEWLQCADLTQYDLIHASPPCQRYSVMTPKEAKDAHPDLLPDVLGRLRKQDTPYIVENVAGTQHLMQNPIFLCGTMFGLDIWRHRWFEIGGVPGVFFLLPPCAHVGSPILVSGRGMRGVTKGGKRPSEPLKATKMQGIQIDWMITKELDEAVPPAYSRFLAEQVKAAAVTR